MSDAPAATPSIAERIQPVAAGGAVVAAHFLGDEAVFVLGEESLLFWRDGTERRAAVPGGGILGVVSDGKRIVTGGDDGKVVATDAKGEPKTIATDPKRRWIDRVAVTDDGVAWAVGKQAFVLPARAKDKTVRTIDLPSSAG